MSTSTSGTSKEATIQHQKPSSVSQWVSKVIAFSSYYDSTGGGWPATNVIGPSNTYPAYGDIHTAWAPKKSNGCDEFLDLEFEKPVFVTSVAIYETYNPGAVTKISSMNPSGIWEVIYSGTPHQDKIPRESRIFSPDVTPKPYVTNRIRIDMDTRKSASWSELDAIKLTGDPVPFNVPEIITKEFSQLINNELFSDIKFDHIEYNPIALSNDTPTPSSQQIRTYNLHKVFLKYRCPKLYEDIVNERLDALSYVTRETMNVLLNYIYTDCITIDENLDSSAIFDQLSRVADEYSIDRLQKICANAKMYGAQNYKLSALAVPTTLVEDLMRALEEVNDPNLEEPVDPQPDILFTFGDSETVAAHRAIICIRSAYFMAMLTRWLGEEGSPEVVDTLEIDATDSVTFRAVLEFIYTAKATVTTENAILLLMAGKQFLLEEFEAPILDVIREGVDASNAFELLQMGYSTSLSDVINICAHYIHENHEVEEPKHLTSLDEELKQLLIQHIPALKYRLYSNVQLRRLSQWVHVATSNNSERVKRLVGPCTVYPPKLGDPGQCWKTTCSPSDYLELKFAYPVYVTGIDIYEIEFPGTIKSISASLNDSSPQLIYESSAVETNTKVCRIFSPQLRLLDRKTNCLRLTFFEDRTAAYGGFLLHGLE